ncbi:MAG: hypothetical protein KDE28_04280, partial [Anaerolineales bacterium]|nr:hypothetical protein [Anaerolineales bacterium]
MKLRLVLILTLWLVACGSATPPKALPTATSSIARQNAPPAEPILPTASAEPTKTAVPRATATPRQVEATPPTATPLPALITATNDTAYQLPIEPITPANLDQIVELASWGRGVINDVAYSGDGRWLAVGASTGVYIHDTQDLSRAPRAFLTPDSVSLVDISFDGELVAVAFNSAMELWDLADQARLWRKTGRFTTLQFAPDGQHLATVSTDGGAVWSLAGVQLFQSLANVLAMEFSADGNQLAAWSYGLLSVYSWPDGQLLAENQPILFDNGEDAVEGEEIPAQGTIVGDVRFNQENEPILLNLPGNIAYGPTGRIELQRGSDEALLLSVPPIEQLSAPMKAACDEPIFFADTLTGPQVWQFELAADTQLVALRYQMRGFGTDDNEYAVVRFHQLQTGELLYEQNGVNAFTLAPDGATWVAGRTDGHLEIRRTSDGEVQQSYDGYDSPITHLASSPDGALIAATYLDEIKLYEAATGSLLLRYPARRLAFAPDGLALAIGYEDGLVEMRTVQDDALLQQLAAHSGPISALTFTPAGDTLVSASLT